MAFVTGLAIGYFVLRTGSLRTGMAIHFVNNALAVVLSAISASFSINGQQTITSIVYVVYLLSGFIAMGWLLTRYSNMFQLHASNTVMSIRGKLTAFFSTRPDARFAGPAGLYHQQILSCDLTEAFP